MSCAAECSWTTDAGLRLICLILNELYDGMFADRGPG